MRISWHTFCVGLVSVARTSLANIDGINFTAAVTGTKKPSVMLGLFEWLVYYFVIGSSLDFWAAASLALLVNTAAVIGGGIVVVCLWVAHSVAIPFTVAISSESNLSTFSLSLPTHVLGL